MEQQALNDEAQADNGAWDEWLAAPSSSSSYVAAWEYFMAGRESLKPLVRQLVAALEGLANLHYELLEEETPAIETAIGEASDMALAAAKAQGFEP